MHGQPPVSIKVFGILNIVFAGLGLIAAAFLAALYYGAGGLLEPGELDEIFASSGYLTFLKLTVIIAVGEAILLLVAGIGLLKHRAWGRSLAIGYAILSLFTTVIGMFVTAHYAGGAEAAGDLKGVAYPIILLVFMLRPNVTRYLTGAGPQPVDGRDHWGRR